MKNTVSSNVQIVHYMGHAKTLQLEFGQSYEKGQVLQEIAYDCALAFNCRAIESDEDNYSTGSTYFIRPCETPRSGLEELALEVFKHHSQGSSFNPSLSGAEWWTQVINPGDDIGVHWDRDYGIEEETGMHIYPDIATVTYFSDKGGPTLVFDKEGTANSSLDITGQIHAVEFCKPRLCKHLAFPGNLLHAAPSSIIYEEEGADMENENDEEEAGEESEDSNKSSFLVHSNHTSHDDNEENLESILSKIESKRITFLVNIWLNHIPSQSIRCVDDLFDKFKLPVSPVQKPCFSLSADNSEGKVVRIEREKVQRRVRLGFVNDDVRYKVLIPLPSREECVEYMDRDDKVTFLYAGRKERGKGVNKDDKRGGLRIKEKEELEEEVCIEVDYSSDQESDEESGEGESGEEESEEVEEDEDESHEAINSKKAPAVVTMSINRSFADINGGKSNGKYLDDTNDNSSTESIEANKRKKKRAS